MVVFKMLHTLIHFVALTKPSNLLLRGKRGITRFCPAKEGELYHSYWQWGKYEGVPDAFLYLQLFFLLQFQRGTKMSTSRIYYHTLLSPKNKNFCKIAKRRKEI